MTIKNEGQQTPQEILNQEDEKFLQSLESEGFELAHRNTPPAGEPTPPADPTPPAPTQPKVEEKKEETPPQDPPKPGEGENQNERQPKYIESWRFKVAEKNWEKEKAQLLTDIETLKNKPNPQADTPGVNEDSIAKLAEKHGVDADLVKDIIDATKNSVKLPDDVLKTIDEYKATQQATIEDAQYSNDFNSNVLPLIQQEYPGITQPEIDSIRQKLKEKAYSETFLKTPLRTIYKGEDDFRGVAKEVKVTLEPGRGRTDIKSIDYDNVTEEQLASMSREEQQKYFEHTDRKK